MQKPEDRVPLVVIEMQTFARTCPQLQSLGSVVETYIVTATDLEAGKHADRAFSDPVLCGDLLGTFFFAGFGGGHILDGSPGLLKGQKSGLLDPLGDILSMVGEVLPEDITVRQITLHSTNRGQSA